MKTPQELRDISHEVENWLDSALMDMGLDKVKMLKPAEVQADLDEKDLIAGTIHAEDMQQDDSVLHDLLADHIYDSVDNDLDRAIIAEMIAVRNKGQVLEKVCEELSFAWLGRAIRNE